MKKHPIQPIIHTPDGVYRFKGNKIVTFLLEAGPFDMNQLALMPFDQDDRQQFAQLIGYSVDGYAELSYHSKQIIAKADARVERLGRSKKGKA